MGRFEASVIVQSTPDVVFDFLIRPHRVLETIPTEAGISYLDMPELLGPGSRLEFQIGGFGVPQRLLHEIVEFEPPRRFTERQVKGPLGRFVHEHLVAVHGDGGVVVTDRIEFDPPGGLAGFLITEARILEALEFSFGHRHRALKALLEQQPSGDGGT